MASGQHQRQRTAVPSVHSASNVITSWEYSAYSIKPEPSNSCLAPNSPPSVDPSLNSRVDFNASDNGMQAQYSAKQHSSAGSHMCQGYQPDTLWKSGAFQYDSMRPPTEAPQYQIHSHMRNPSDTHTQANLLPDESTQQSERYQHSHDGFMVGDGCRPHISGPRHGAVLSSAASSDPLCEPGWEPQAWQDLCQQQQQQQVCASGGQWEMTSQGSCQQFPMSGHPGNTTDAMADFDSEMSLWVLQNCGKWSLFCAMCLPLTGHPMLINVSMLLVVMLFVMSGVSLSNDSMVMASMAFSLADMMQCLKPSEALMCITSKACNPGSCKLFDYSWGPQPDVSCVDKLSPLVHVVKCTSCLQAMTPMNVLLLSFPELVC